LVPVDGSAIFPDTASSGGWRRVVPAAGERWRYPALSILRVQGSPGANEYHWGHWRLCGFGLGPGRL